MSKARKIGPRVPQSVCAFFSRNPQRAQMTHNYTFQRMTQKPHLGLTDAHSRFIANACAGDQYKSNENRTWECFFYTYSFSVLCPSSHEKTLELEQGDEKKNIMILRDVTPEAR